MTGATCSRTKSRTVARSASCSSSSRKSTISPLLSDGRDAVPAPREAAVLAAGGGEAADDFGTQVARLDDRIDDQLAGQPHDVDVALVLGAAVGDERGALLVRAEGGDLVGVDRVD